MGSSTNEPLRTREHSEIEYDCSSADLSINYLVNSATGTITFRTEKIPADIIENPDFKKFLESHEGIMSAKPHYRYAGDPRVVALFQTQSQTFAQILEHAKTLKDRASFALEMSRTPGRVNADGTASTLLRYLTIATVGDKIRLTQEEVTLPPGNPAAMSRPIQNLLKRIESTQNAMVSA